MSEYYIPSGPGEAEFTEKRSRFLGHVRMVETELPCGYAQMEKMKQEAQAAGGVVEDVEYGANVILKVLVPEKQSAAFAGQIFDQSNGSVTVRVTGESFRAVPLR